MVFVSANGSLGASEGWSLSTIPNMFWGMVNVLTLFFQTLVNPQLTKRGTGYSSNYRASGRSGPAPGAPSRRFGGLGRCGGAGPPPVSGGG